MHSHAKPVIYIAGFFLAVAPRMKGVLPTPPNQRFLAYLLAFALSAFMTTELRSQSFNTPCNVCGKGVYHAGAAYYAHDKVTGEKVYICRECNELDHRCFACGLPVRAGGKVLQDGRHYCPRDGDRAITDPKQMQKIVTETIEKLDVGLRHYMEFPETNLQVDMIDRINLEQMVAKAGNDYSCPDLRGYYQTITNEHGVRTHSIHMMTGHDDSNTQSTFVHEMTHAWIADNVPEGRDLDRLAHEGFCELISYIIAQQAGDTNAIFQIERNAYTRGQFDLFKEAKQQFELQTILDWMRYGNEPLIDGSDIAHVRLVTKPRKELPKLWVRYSSKSEATTPTNAEQSTVTEESPVPTELQLKGIVGSGPRRMAMISGRSFMIGEKGNVRLGEKQVEIRCVEIGGDFARIELIDSGEEKTLKLPVAD